MRCFGDQSGFKDHFLSGRLGHAPDIRSSRSEHPTLPFNDSIIILSSLSPKQVPASHSGHRACLTLGHEERWHLPQTGRKPHNEALGSDSSFIMSVCRRSLARVLAFPRFYRAQHAKSWDTRFDHLNVLCTSSRSTRVP